ALVGGSASHPSPRIRRSRRRAFAEPRLLLLASGLDLRQALAGDAARPDRRLREVPRNPVAEPLDFGVLREVADQVEPRRLPALVEDPALMRVVEAAVRRMHVAGTVGFAVMDAMQTRPPE